MLEQKLTQFAANREYQCPSCGNQGLVIGTSLSAEVIHCHSCDLSFLKKSIRPNSANDNDWYEDLKDCPQSWVDSFISDMEEAYSRQLTVLEKLAPGKKIIDIGCGIGIFLAIAKNKNWQVFGAEESEHGTYFAKNNFNIKYTSNLDEFSENTFDVIRISHVLEHVPEPQEFLAKLHRILKPGGILMIIVPNCEPLCSMVVNIFRRLRSEKPRLTCAVYPDMHVLGFSPKSLINLTSLMLFESINVFTTSMGDRTYYPMFYDGLLTRKKWQNISVKPFFKYYLPIIINNLGNRFQRGEWIVGYFKK
ncbi:MAG: methyltransferase domain-containing protein [Nostoc sp. ChiSLP02]|nr:methyltransferase domain-containing protein [Nostoc sp. DedSLP05]MDZ8100806.1 methyltransferase domain-containing protein [Nostoc sp. DedSLP01]MDZ8188205.1 methyltransferase domain-containing protein [Nostoc sp. ChiSLP02]